MHPLIKQHRADLERLCRQYRVKRLELFGSAAKGDFDESTSDLDFLVEYLPLETGTRSKAYFGLLHALEDLLGREVDLVMAKAIRNPYFLESVNESRTTLYAA